MNVFKFGFLESVREPRELIENVLGRLCLQGIPFTILPSGTDENEKDLDQVLNQIDDQFAGMNTLPESKSIPYVAEFFEKHCISRT